MKINPALLLFVILAARALAADEPQSALTVAVYSFTGEADARNYGGKVTALVTADLTAQPNLILLERAELKKELNEQAFGISGLVSADAAAQIGEITGAKVLVSGQVIMTEHNHLVIVANIIGTETGRLFAAKMEGGTDNLTGLTSELSSKIAQTIADQATNLTSEARESSAARLDRIVKSIKGTKRPSVSINIFWPKGKGGPCLTAETEFGAILIRAGFPVVDNNSERKAEVGIKGLGDHSEGPRRGELFTFRSVIELKVQERRTGNFITIDRQESLATDPTRMGADRSAQVQAVDELAERVLPLLAQ